jgi:hypothetical protein
MLQLRDYQVKLANEGCDILKNKGLVYFALQVRVGKTLTALQTAENFGAKNVLFLTKIKAFSSIQWDYDQMNFSFKLTIGNDESLHKITDTFDLVIHDEHHRFGAYPKPNTTAKLFKEKFSHLPMIFLSGTPTAESHSQWYHQMWVSDYSPFKDYPNFYKWAADFVNVKQKHLGFTKINDYSDADIKHINRRIKYNLLTFTQEQAGFTSTVNEMVLEVEMKPITYQIIERLKRDLVVKNQHNQLILADTAVKLQQKVHQLSSGTCKFEDGTSKVIDYTKAEYIRDNFKDVKIGIFYKFKEEWNALKEIIGDNLTDNLDEFNTTDKNIALQITSGREGISLKEAKYLVYYNIDFSSVSYWQSRDRLTEKTRLSNEVFWIFAKKGIENSIYKTVLTKKDYTTSLFLKDFGIKKIEKKSSRIRG